MTREEMVLFNQYYYMTKDLGGCDNEEFYNFILNFVLNSEEMKNSKLGVCENQKSFLLGLTVTPTFENSYNSSFSGMYYVGDEKVSENRIISGNITFKDDGIYVVSEISRFSKMGYISSIELVEVYRKDNYGFSKYYDYSGTDYVGREYISSEEFDKSVQFKRDTIKLIRNK